MGQVTTIQGLIENFKMAWKTIPPNILENLIDGMPKRMKLVIDKSSDYINK